MAWKGDNPYIMPIYQAKDLVVLLPRPKTIVLKTEVRPPTRDADGTHLNLMVNEIYHELMERLNIDIVDIDTIQIIQNDIFLPEKTEEMVEKIKQVFELDNIQEKVRVAGHTFTIERAEPSYMNKREHDLVVRLYGCPAEIPDGP